MVPMMSRIARLDDDGSPLPEVIAAIAAAEERFGVQLDVIPWHSISDEIELVLCEAGTKPERPAWDALQIVKGDGDCFAIHPWYIHTQILDEHMEREVSLREIEDGARQIACIIQWMKTGSASELFQSSQASKSRKAANRGEWT